MSTVVKPRTNKLSILFHAIKHAASDTPHDGNNKSASTAPASASTAFGLRHTKDFVHLYEDSTCLIRIFLNAAPIACVMMVIEEVIGDLPWFVDVIVCVAVSFFLSFLHLFTSRLASICMLGAGSMVVNLNCERPPSHRIIVYETHRDPGCRILRAAFSMLGWGDIEIRSCPEEVAGVPSPWRRELTAILEKEGKPFALPYVIGIDLPQLQTHQGDGFAMTKDLMNTYSLDPKEVFPLDLDAKALKTLATIASHIRAYLPWGVKASPICWSRLNEVRETVNLAAGIGARDRFSKTTTMRQLSIPNVMEEDDDGHERMASPSTNPLSPNGILSSPNGASSPRSSPETPRSGPSASPMSSPSSSSSLTPMSPSTPSASALKLRAQLQRQALARSNGTGGSSSTTSSAGRHMDDEELLPVSHLTDLQPLTIYGTEANANCRPLFELCCSLQLPYVLHTCAQGSIHRAKLILEHKDHFKLPTLIDPNTRRVLVGTPTCVEYVLQTYTDGHI